MHMERSGWLLAVGVIVVVIVLVVVFMTGTQSYGQGYGPGQQAGQGYGRTMTQGYGNGQGAAAPVLLPVTDTSPLTATEEEYILYMREEEQMAHDLYTRWAGIYSVPIFSNIADSESQHVAEVQLLIERYGLQDRPAGNAAEGYHDPVIQNLYDTLAAQGGASITGALESGLAVEETDIADLDMALANTTRADIRGVYLNLRQGSVNHRSAFLRQLGR